MSKLSGWWTRLSRAINRRAFDQQMVEEMREHLERESAVRQSQGEDPANARRSAAIAFGHAEARKEEVRDRRLGRWADELAQDGRQAVRVLRKSPGFAFVAVTTLALCIAANVVLFSLVDAILLRPYPYPAAERVVNVGMVWPKWPWGDMVQEISPLTFIEVKESARSLSAVGFIDANGKADLHLGDRALRLNIASVTPGVWTVAGVSPALGRCFDERDLAAGESHLVVLSHELWRDTFNRDTAIIGQMVQLDDLTYQVLGVMPSGFSVAANRSKLWIPKVFSAEDKAENSRGSCAFQAIGRLRDGVSVEQARDELTALYAGFLAAHPEAGEFTDQTGQTYGVAPLSTWVSDRSSGSMLFSMQLAAGLVLLLGCLNIAGLLVVRGHKRRREIALRSALGATRRRIARQLAMETVVLFLCGGTVGAGVAAAALRFVPEHFHLSEIIPYGQGVGFDVRILAITLGLSLVTGLLTGSLPILFATRRNLSGILQALSHQSSSGRNRRWTQSAFVVGQVALAMVLLTAAGVTVRNLRNLLGAGFGVATEHRLVASVALPAYRYGAGFPATEAKINPFKEQALERIRSLPGVVHASVSNRVPLSGDWPSKFGFQVPGYQPAPGESPAYSFAYQVHPGYPQTLGMPLLRGRDLARTDNASAPTVAVISEAIARKYFASRDPVGARISSVYGRECEIIGVVGETQNVPLSLGNAPAIYFSALQWPAFNDEAVFVVHTALLTDGMAATVTQALVAGDPLLSVRVTDLARMQESAVVTQSTPMEIAAFFAMVAVLLTALGLYGVLASSVAQRTRELAIRLALGAPHRSIFRRVFVSGGTLALTGIALGGLVALPMLRWIKPLLKASDATPPEMLLYAAVLIMFVTLLATYFPARRAARVDPIVALRND